MLVIVEVDTVPETPATVATALAEVAVMHELVVVCSEDFGPRGLAEALRRCLPRFSVVTVVTDTTDRSGQALVGELVEAGGVPVVAAVGDLIGLVAELERRLRADLVLEMVTGPRLQWLRHPVAA
ncbi:hypothetical protein [Longispora urticae]